MSISILVIAIGAPIVVIYYIMIYIPDQQRKEIKKKLGDISQIHLTMDGLRDKTNIQRVLIFRANNGKEISRFGNQIYVSTVYQSIEQPFVSVLAKYQDLKVDGQYVKMLKHILDNGEMGFFTHDMPDGLLREIYESENVYWSYVFKIGEDRDRFYFGSLATSHHESPIQLGQGTEIRLALNKIRNMYAKMNHGLMQKIRRKLYL